MDIDDRKGIVDRSPAMQVYSRRHYAPRSITKSSGAA